MGAVADLSKVWHRMAFGQIAGGGARGQHEKNAKLDPDLFTSGGGRAVWGSLHRRGVNVLRSGNQALQQHGGAVWTAASNHLSGTGANGWDGNRRSSDLLL